MTSFPNPAAETHLLGQLSAVREDRDRAEADLLAMVCAWADANPWRDGPRDYSEGGFGDECPDVPHGCPEYDVPAAAELAAILGMSTSAGEALVSDALSLRHRMPRLWARVQSLEVPVWRARRVARSTSDLTRAAAGFVDDQVAPRAHTLGPTALDHAVESARERFMPGEAERLARERLERRRVSVDRRTAHEGTCQLFAELDVADALDLEQAVAAAAGELEEHGPEQPLDVRRSQALGLIARRYLGDAEPDRASRRLTLYVHLPADGATATLEGTGPVPIASVRSWCENGRVTIRPVLDLAAPRSATTYAVPDVLREQVVLRDRTCAFPHCERSARACDLDHVVPFANGGPTSTDNLAPLCRRHHRLKTHAGWSYRRVADGYRWSGPGGREFSRDAPRPYD